MRATPAGVLQAELAAGRQRGEAFQDVWPAAFERALAAAPRGQERDDWAHVLAGMSATWRRAFEGEPASGGERAVLALMDDDRVPIPERPCAHCGHQMPAASHPNALYCDERCSAAERARRYRAMVAA